ncbi:MAG: 3'-5' exonuclease [Prevotella sp.]|nr:3'-5' exonuclease [Prevotella sp.]
MQDFAAIDFETANGCRTSVCSVGLVVVEGGEVAERCHRLIRPVPNFYAYRNTLVHGLTFEDTKDAPLFPDVWAEIAPKIRYLPLVAHNRPFDEGCLKAVFRAFDMEYPDYEFHCTLQWARRKLKGVLPNFQLQTVAAYCGFDLDRHHHALADAEACAAIARKLV